MTHHSPIQEIYMEGQYWVPRDMYRKVFEQLREKQRSAQSHNRFFAHIHDLYQNLPVSHAGAPYAASQDAFRKHGLINTGHCDIETIDVGSHEGALQVAPLVADLARKAHGCAVTIVRGPLVVCTTPHSQSFKAMGKDLFHKSVADVEAWAECLLGVA